METLTPPAPHGPWLLRPKDLEAQLGLSKPTIARLLARGEFGADAVVRIGRSIRVRSDSVRRWIDEQSS